MDPTPGQTASQPTGITLDWSVTSDSPELARALSYWNKKRGARSMPARGEIVPSDIRDILPLVQLYDVHKAGDAYRVRLLGTAVAQLFDNDPTGLEFDHTWSHPLVVRMLTVLRAVARERKPVIARAERTAIDSVDYSAIESIYLPLSDDGTSVNIVFSVSVLRSPARPRKPSFV